MQNLAIGLGIFGIALVISGVWLYNRNQKKAALQVASEGPDLPESSSGIDATPEDEDTLMDAIIALDDQFKSGNLPEDAYLERRAVLKEKLRNINQG